MEELNARVWTYQNVKVDNDDFYSVGLTHDLEHYIMSNYGRHLVHMLIAQTKQLWIVQCFPYDKHVGMSPTLGEGSVVVYELMKVCDLPMVNTFKIGPSSPDSKPQSLILQFFHLKLA